MRKCVRYWLSGPGLWSSRDYLYPYPCSLFYISECEVFNLFLVLFCQPEGNVLEFIYSSIAIEYNNHSGNVAKFLVNFFGLAFSDVCDVQLAVRKMPIMPFIIFSTGVDVFIPISSEESPWPPPC